MMQFLTDAINFRKGKKIKNEKRKVFREVFFQAFFIELFLYSYKRYIENVN